MKVYFGLPSVLKFKSPVLAIGVFDGVHKGHRAILKKLCSLKGTPVVLTFDSLPEHVIAPAYAPATVTGLEQKLSLLKAAGIRAALVAHFDGRFAALSAEDFSKKIERLGVREIVVGADFVFGAHASGNAEFLRARGHRVHVVKPVLQGGRPVSSTRVRSCIADGDMKEAEKLLGRPFSMIGRVKRGAQLGRKMGYPTANLELLQELLPKAGVWGGRVRILPEKRWRPMLANLGTRPTLSGKQFLTELHLLDFKGNLYAKQLEAELMLYLRPEQRFENLDALKHQIRLDEVRFRRSRAFHSALRSSGARLG